jgi:hypothetical protein
MILFILLILYKQFDQEKMPPVTRSIACMRFLERLNKFNYMQWKTIDPEKLEYVSLSSKPFRYIVMIMILVL